MTNERMREAATARALGVQAPTNRPSQRRSQPDEGGGLAAVRGRLSKRGAGDVVEQNGLRGVLVGGLACVTNFGYEMWDWYGPYEEIVALDAFDITLAADPLVEFTVNHGAGGALPMAHTRNSTLQLLALKEGEETGLDYTGLVDHERSDVATMLKALERGDLAEASFKFRINKGRWSEDWMTYTILEVDLHRGDVSAVNFGANPAATSELRRQPAASTPRTLSRAVDLALLGD
jgi:HK97 family phage prohead protease